MKSKPVWYAKHSYDQMENNGDVNIVTIIYKASVLLYIKKTLQLT